MLKIITAKFQSTCAETGATIRKGDACVFDTSARKVYTLDSKKAKDNEQDANNADAAYIQAQENEYIDNISRFIL